MLFETLNQHVVFCFIFLIGLSSGACYGIALFIRILFNKNTAVTIITDVVLGVTINALLFFSLMWFNYGEIRVFAVMAFVLGFAVERLTTGKLFAFIYKFIYNKLNKVAKAFKISKVGKVILK